MMDLAECCLTLRDDEDKLHSLRIRKIGQLLKWLRSLSVEYMTAEGIDASEVSEMKRFLELERWMREEIEKGD